MRTTAVSVLCPAVFLLTSCSGEAPATRVTTGETVELSTHCGIRFLQVGNSWFERDGGLLGSDGNPPPGWGNPVQVGTVTVTGEVAVFTDGSGHHERFQKLDSAPAPSATGCA